MDGGVEWSTIEAGTTLETRGCTGNESSMGFFGSRILLKNIYKGKIDCNQFFHQTKELS